MLGTNLYLTHLFPLSVNPQTIQAVYTGTTMTKIKYYSGKNRVSISSNKKMKKVISETRGNKDEINMVCWLSSEGLEGVKEIMEVLLNLAALDFSI